MTPAIRGLYAAFAGLGATAAVIPAVLPSVEQGIGTSVVSAIPALFGGLLAGVLASSVVLRRVRALHLAAIGCLVQAVALTGAALAGTAPGFIAFAALAGLGFGLTEASASVASKAASTSSTAAILTALTATVAVTAALTPLLVALAAGTERPPLVLLVVAAAQFAAAVALLAGARGSTAPARGERRRGLRRASVLALLPLAIALPLYVGVETVFAGWSAVIPAGLLRVDPAAAALGTSVFWGLMAVGRFASSAMLRGGVTTRRALLLGTLTAAGVLGVAAVVTPTAPVFGLVAIAVAVVALAPTYALTVGLALDRLDDDEAAKATGVLVACGAAGGSFVPAAILLLTEDPTASATFVATAVICLVVAALSAIPVRTASPAVPGSRTA
ncbi:uncharacterized membrane protein YhaH (DUF805 family) [Agromyces hippuratus]|uniref:Uncharacterized membrane protein YhaH (DUF805 family) n=1 Tax=Agromyces hippuratus TaxID=286438 RepID=A0A852WXW0_9MICO|nr:hypothetical protein [Agromyces hippuratus]NYG22457.1 uncharacterized membrane protein YhaH (DUF805 family) [Agromyces hippuratus]